MQPARARLLGTLVLALAGAAGAACAASDLPPAPDYAQASAWAAWPGRPSGADAVAPGLSDAPLSDALKADVFFIHPTTYLAGHPDNARYDEPGATSTQIDQGVLRFQASAFNACCRIYAPHYRQAVLAAFLMKDEGRAEAAYQLAYSDVSRAFEYYLVHENQGRPFILASHSQGSLHAIRLLQERIAGRTLERQLVAAYIIGYYVPQEIERRGVPVCRTATQTGCFVDWNTVKSGHSDSSRESTRLVWLDGRYQHEEGRPVVCVNPLNWQPGGSADASLNLGALPGVRPGAALQAPVAALTGAQCEGGALHIDIPFARRAGFSNVLTLFGSYHIFDYNVFYVNIRSNAVQRLAAWRTAERSGHP